jgi:hypothetical protein
VIQIKFRYKSAPGGVQVRVFSGQEGKTLSCNGTLSFTKAEWEVFLEPFLNHPYDKVVAGKKILLMEGGELTFEKED